MSVLKKYIQNNLASHRITVIGILLALSCAAFLAAHSFHNALTTLNAAQNEQNLPIKPASHAKAYVDGQLLVRFKPNVQNQEAVIQHIVDEIQFSTAFGNATRTPPTGVSGKQTTTTEPTVEFPLVLQSIQDINPIRPFSSEVAKAINVRSRVSTDSPAVQDAQNTLSRWKIVTFNPEADIKVLAASITADPNIEVAEPNFYASLLTETSDPGVDSGGEGIKPYGIPVTPNDYFYSRSDSWGQIYDDLWGLHRLSMPHAWSQTTGSSSIVVAVSDTGIDYNHPDLQNNVWTNADEIPNNGVDDDNNGCIDDIYGCDFYNLDGDPLDDNGHGTHVAGTIAAVSNNTIGVTGMSWNTKIMGVKWMNQAGEGDCAKATQSVNYAAENGADVINMSWHVPQCQALADAITLANLLGVVQVVAAGNTGSEISGYPARDPLVISVGAWDPSNTLASFSSYGPTLDLVAPGVDILSLRANNTDMYGNGLHIVPDNGGNPIYYRASGTSMAAPHVAGAVALVLAARPTLTPDLVRTVLHDTAEDVLNPGRDDMSGHGLINPKDAVLKAFNLTNPLPEFVSAYSKLIRLNERQSRVNFAVKNIGLGNATNVQYQVFIGDPGVGRIAISGTIPAISAGTRVDREDTFDMAANDPTFVTIRIDPANAIPEYSEENNDMTANMTIRDTDGWPKSGDPVPLWFSLWFPGNPEWWPSSFYGTPSLVELDQSYAGLEVVASSYDGKVYAWHSDGTPVKPAGKKGWPRTTNGLVFSSPTVADIDPSYPGLEVISGTSLAVYGSDTECPCSLYAWHWDGTPVTGWPKILESMGAVAVADIDPLYAGPEIVVAPNGIHPNWQVYVLHGDGTNAPGWPVTTSVRPNLTGVTVADLDLAHPGLEIIIGTYDRILAYYSNGELIHGWPYGTYHIYSTPAVGDVNGDGLPEVVASSLDGYCYSPYWYCDYPGRLYVVSSDGQSLPNYPMDTAAMWAAPILVDIDSGALGLEILVSDQQGVIHAWRGRDGGEVNGWPVQTNAGIYAQLAVADLDGDGSVEIIANANDSKVYAYHTDGSPVSGFPLGRGKNLDQPWSEWSSPVVADLNGDSMLDVVIGSTSPRVYAWSMPWVSTGDPAPWPMLGQNLGHTGVKAAVHTIHTITASAGANGSISPSGAVTVNEGSSQTFTITPSAGYGIESLYIDDVPTPPAATYTFTNVTADHTIRATFATTLYTMSTADASLTVQAGLATATYVRATSTSAFFGPVQLTATGAPAGTTLNFVSGSTLTIPLPGGMGQKILNISTSPTTPAGTSTITVTGSVTGWSASTNFELTVFPLSHTITASAGANGSISPSGAVTVNEGSSQTFTITPSAGYGIESLYIDDVPTPPAATYTFTNVTADHTIRATFATTLYNLTTNPTARTIQAGQTTSTFVVLTSVSEFSGPVQLTATGAPTGTTVTISPTTAVIPFAHASVRTILLNVATSSSTPVGTSTITVTGTANGWSASTNFTLTVTPPPFTISITNLVNNSGFNVPLNPTPLTISVAITGGCSINKVEYYKDSYLIYTATVSPYSGSYVPSRLNDVGKYRVFTAKAYDSCGNTAVSPGITIYFYSGSGGHGGGRSEFPRVFLE